MSIINDALKKASRNREDFISYQSKRPDLPTTEYRKKRRWEPVFAFLILLLIAGPVVAPHFSTPSKKSPSLQTAVLESTPDQLISDAADDIEAPENAASTGHTQSMAQNSNQKSQFIIEELPRTLPPSMTPQPSAVIRPSFILKGVVASNGFSYCIVNDKLIKVGGMVDGAKVVAIEADKVTLDYNNESIALTIAG